MKRRFHHLIGLIYLVVSPWLNDSFSQSSAYTIESFQSAYQELEKYESLYLLTGGNVLWDYEFELEFMFPFFDSLYSRIMYDQSAWGSFTDEQDEAILLMDCVNSYAFDTNLDTSNLTSDVRFAHVMDGNIPAFVLQFTNMRFFADPFGDSLDTYMNFQIWLKENGVLEVHFGEMHMDDTPIYEPGVGFYFYTTEGGVDTSEICGPHMGISHPLNEDDAIALLGSYDDFEVVGDRYGNLTVLPPEGWVIRFKPMSVATADPDGSTTNVVITPNPANSSIRLSRTDGRVMISDATGRIVWRGTISENGTIDVATLTPGIYFLQQISPEGISTGKFVKE